MRRLAIGIAVLALALSGCEMRAEISVNDDGSGTFGFVFAMEPFFFNSIPGDVNPLSEIEKGLRDDPVDWKLSHVNESGLRGIRATASFGSIEEFREMMRALADDQGLDSGAKATLDDRFVIEQVGDGWRLRADGTSPSGSIPRFPGQDVGLPDSSLRLPPEINSLIKVEFQVTLPGKVSSSNADEVREDGGRTTFVWRPSALGDAVELRAQTVAAGGAFPVVPVAGGLLAASVAVFFVLRRRPSSGPPPPVVLEGFPLLQPVAAGREHEGIEAAEDASEMLREAMGE